MLSWISEPAILTSQAGLPEDEKSAAPSILLPQRRPIPEAELCNDWHVSADTWGRPGEIRTVQMNLSCWPTESRATYMFVVLATKLWVGLLVLKATYWEKFPQVSDIWNVFWRMNRSFFFCYFYLFFFWKVSLGEWSRNIPSLFCLHVGLIVILRQPSYSFL